MNTIEDCLETLSFKASAVQFSINTVPVASKVSEWDQKFITDVAAHTIRGSFLSTAQADIAVKLIRRYIDLFNPNDQASVLRILEDKKFRFNPIQSVQAPREVRWIGGAILVFRFQYNAHVVNGLKDLTSDLEEIAPKTILQGKKSWKIVVDSSNYRSVMNFIKAHNFAFDDSVLEFFMHINNNLENDSKIWADEEQIHVEINNDALSVLWLSEMEWLRDV